MGRYGTNSQTYTTRDLGRTRSRAAFLLVAIAVVSSLGCRSNGRYDSIEAELRTRNRELEEARAELQSARLLSNTYGRHNEGLAAPCAPDVPRGAGPTANTSFPIATVSLGTGTGGLDADNRPGDEMLQVVIVPKDDDGQAIKVPARANIQALEVNKEGIKTPIGNWDIPAETLKKSWRTSLLGAGYSLPLQWDKPPTSDRVRIIVRFTTMDGRSFEAEKEVNVKVLPGLQPPPTIPFPASLDELPFPAARMKPARAIE